MSVSRERLRREAERAIDEVLAGREARRLESQTLDFKELKRPAAGDRDLLKAAATDLAEAAACLANSRGATVVVGVRDDTPGPAAVVGVPAGVGVGVDDLRRRIWQCTSPPLVVDVDDARTLVGAVFLDDVSGAARRVELGPALRQVGFVGEAQLRLLRSAPSAAGEVFGALLRFAELAGVGAQTTCGFGAVEVTLPTPTPARTHVSRRRPVAT